MYAVIRTGGKQYRVAPDEVIEVEKLAGEAGETVQFGEVLMLGGDGAPQVGAPTVSGASVAGQVVEQKRGDKVVIFKKKRRKGYRRTKGHRQHLTTVRITEILTGGKAPSKTTKTQAKAGTGTKSEEKKPAAKKAQAKPASSPKAESKSSTAKAKAPAKTAGTKKGETKTAAPKKAAPKAKKG